MITMAEEMRDLIDIAVANGTPCILATATKTGEPHMSFRGSMMVLDDASLAYWDGSVTKRLLCIPVESTYACKTRGEVALWVTRGHREGRTEIDVARGGEDGDGYRRWGSGLSSCAHPFLLPPPRGEADAQTSQPMPCQEALL